MKSVIACSKGGSTVERPSVMTWWQVPGRCGLCSGDGWPRMEIAKVGIVLAGARSGQR